MEKEKKDFHGTAPARPWQTKEIALALLLIIAWLIGSIGGFRAEYSWLKTAPNVLSLDATQNKLKLVGPAYRLIDSVESATPVGSTVYFFNPSRYDAATYFYVEARYYLYPRRIINGGARAAIPEIKKSDYLMVFITPQTPASAVDPVRSMPFLKQVSGYSGYDSYWVLYKVEKGGAQ